MDIISRVIRSNRLDLVLLDSDMLRHSLAGDLETLQSGLNVEVPPDWFAAQELIELRYRQILREPAYQPWSLRAITLREKRKMIGHIGFHSRPGASYLQSFAPRGVEFGFSIFPQFSRKGYAREASVALMQWAYQQHSVSEFVLSISPDNFPSLGLAHGLGFVRVGSHMDEVDGVEDIYRLDYHQILPA